MEDSDSYRKATIGSKLTKLFTDNPEYTVAQLLHTITRTKNIRVGEKDSYFMNDEDFNVALDSTLKEFRTKDND